MELEGSKRCGKLMTSNVCVTMRMVMNMVEGSGLTAREITKLMVCKK